MTICPVPKGWRPCKGAVRPSTVNKSLYCTTVHHAGLRTCIPEKVVTSIALSPRRAYGSKEEENCVSSHTGSLDEKALIGFRPTRYCAEYCLRCGSNILYPDLTGSSRNTCRLNVSGPSPVRTSPTVPGPYSWDAIIYVSCSPTWHYEWFRIMF
jgi:hypothetical protein